MDTSDNNWIYKPFAERYLQILDWFDLEINEETAKLFVVAVLIRNHYYNLLMPTNDEYWLQCLKLYRYLQTFSFNKNPEGIKLQANNKGKDSLIIQDKKLVESICNHLAEMIFKSDNAEDWIFNGYLCKYELLDNIIYDNADKEISPEDIISDYESDGWEKVKCTDGSIMLRKDIEDPSELTIEMVDDIIKHIEKNQYDERDYWKSKQGNHTILFGGYINILLDYMPQKLQTKSDQYNVAGAILEKIGIFDDYPTWQNKKLDSPDQGKYQYNNDTFHIIRDLIKANNGKRKPFLYFDWYVNSETKEMGFGICSFKGSYTSKIYDWFLLNYSHKE